MKSSLLVKALLPAIEGTVDVVFEDTKLWNDGFQIEEGNKFASELVSALMKMRTQVEVLVGEIAVDLKSFTMHDLSHLDALWEIADQIVGKEFRFNPLEAFVFGAAVLLHDAGMSTAAYPGGVEEIRRQRSWTAALLKVSNNPSNPTESETNAAVLEVLRSEHATRAMTLATTEWRDPSGRLHMLLEDGNLRQKLAQFAGSVAASHWWSHDKVKNFLDRIIPSPPPFPVSWRIDLLKIASLLRLADASHLDERRAPSFLWALRARNLDEESSRHWRFQNKIGRPERRSDALYYCSTSDFLKNETKDWWLAFDTLKMVDLELRKTDLMLAELRGDSARFAAKRVYGTESPEAMTRSITVSGWTPVDAKLHISNVKKLVETLGGAALYGNDPRVAIRELVQNAVDAIALRRAVDSSFAEGAGVIEIDLTLIEGKYRLIVKDNGIGMEKETLTGCLLDFGSSGWRNDPAYVASLPLDSSARTTIGKFGIGFFSVFMIAKNIEVVTRRYDKARADTLSLVFYDGLESRPILCPAEAQHWIGEGGTKIIAEIEINEHTKLLIEEKLETICGKLFPALPIAIDICQNGVKKRMDASKWRTESGEMLLSRIWGADKNVSKIRKIAPLLTPILDINEDIVGRMAIVPMKFDDGSTRSDGVLTAKGIAVSDMRMVGLIESNVLTADRRRAMPMLDTKKLAQWCSAYEQKVSKFYPDGDDEAEISQLLWALGHKPQLLRICETAEGWLNLEELKEFIKNRQKIVVVQDAAWSNFHHYHSNARLCENVIAISMGYPAIFNRRDNYGPFYQNIFTGSLEEIVLHEINEAYELDEAGVNEDGTDSYDVPMALLEGDIFPGRGNVYFRGMTIADVRRLRGQKAR